MKYGRLRQNEAKLIPLNQYDKLSNISEKLDIIRLLKYNYRNMSPTNIDPYQIIKYQSEELYM